VMPDCPLENVIAYCDEAARHSLALQEKRKTHAANAGGRGFDEPLRENGRHNYDTE